MTNRTNPAIQLDPVAADARDSGLRPIESEPVAGSFPHWARSVMPQRQPEPIKPRRVVKATM